MQKFSNDPRRFVDDALSGILLAHGDYLRACDDPRVIVRASAPEPGRVAIATGGGFGHLPLFLGYVGAGLADGAAVGNVFASPSSEQILAVTNAINGGAGVLYVYGNYAGDVMNFELAAELAAASGIEVASVIASDDIASAPKGEEAHRRGIAGIFFIYKIAGARATEGGSLAEVRAVAEKAADRIRSLGVALGPCTLPGAHDPNFHVADGEMEIGMGIHGEPGVRTAHLQPADELVDQIVSSLADELGIVVGDRIAVLLNGLGATSREELYLLYRATVPKLAAAGATINRVWIGEFATSFEMAGASLSILKLDPELSRLLGAPAHSPLLGQV